MSSKQFKRAEAMVCADKFGLRAADFASELGRFVSAYMDYDGLTVELTRGTNANLVVTVSVKKVKPTLRM